MKMLINFQNCIDLLFKISMLAYLLLWTLIVYAKSAVTMMVNNALVLLKKNYFLQMRVL